METLTCPKCGSEMRRAPGPTNASVCPEGHGVFLERADLGALVEAENDWHRNAGQHTAPLPKITPDMAPPPSSGRHARAWVETLFD